MFDHLVFSVEVLSPLDAAALREATRIARGALSGNRVDLDAAAQERLAGEVLRVARCGYGRALDGTIDALLVAEAAVLRFKGCQGTDKAGTASLSASRASNGQPEALAMSRRAFG